MFVKCAENYWMSFRQNCNPATSIVPQIFSSQLTVLNNHMDGIFNSNNSFTYSFHCIEMIQPFSSFLSLIFSNWCDPLSYGHPLRKIYSMSNIKPAKNRRNIFCGFLQVLCYSLSIFFLENEHKIVFGQFYIYRYWQHWDVDSGNSTNKCKIDVMALYLYKGAIIL